LTFYVTKSILFLGCFGRPPKIHNWVIGTMKNTDEKNDAI
jgi:hypothetical protein